MSSFRLGVIAEARDELDLAGAAGGAGGAGVRARGEAVIGAVRGAGAGGVAANEPMWSNHLLNTKCLEF